MKVAFYKGTSKGIKGLYNIAVRAVTKGSYSHCEILFSDGMSASASFIDGGVRFKRINFDPEHWDFIELSNADESKARTWFDIHNHESYDIFGNIRFIFWPVSEERYKWFCSESIAKALGLTQAWRYDPNTLYSALKFMENAK